MSDIGLRRLIGEILCEKGFLTGEQLARALQAQRDLPAEPPPAADPGCSPRVREARMAADPRRMALLGEILVRQGAITLQQLTESLEEQDRSYKRHRAVESEQLGAAIEMAFLLNASLDLREVLGRIMRNVTRVIGAEAGTLMLLDERSGELVFSLPTGPAADRLADYRLPLGKGVAGWAAQQRMPVRVDDAGSDTHFFSAVDQATGFRTRSILCAPLVVRDRLIGVLEVINRADGAPFSEQDEFLLAIFGQLASLAIENARLHQETQERLQDLQDEERRRRHAEQVRREFEQRYRSIFEHGALGIFQTTPNGDYLVTNPALARMLGYASPQEAEADIQSVPRQVLTRLRGAWRVVRELEADRRACTFEERLRRRDGSIWTGRIHVHLVRDEHGSPLYLEGFVEDITGREE